MAKSLDTTAKRAIAARLEYYREMGIGSFYRRSAAPVQAGASTDVLTATSTEVQEALDDPGVAPNPASEIGAGPALPNFAATAAGSSDKVSALQEIRDFIGDCTRCRLSKGRTKLVFGVGDPDAAIMFVGEGPGADEDLQGEPFVGRAGQLLNNMIVAMGIRREDVYIANVVKCRPPGNRTPEKDECDTCSPFLMRQMDTVKPKMVVALGAVAAKTLLGLNDTMANLRGKIYDFRGTKLAVTYHPAYLLRDPRQKGEAWKDLQMVMRHLGMQLPQKQEG